jgi:TonB-linked SusC/RagA family outer membrane protein
MNKDDCYNLKRNKGLFSLFSFFLFFSAFTASAQNMINGRVLNSLNEPLGSASVTNKSNSTSVTTKSNGEFSIAGKKGDVLEISNVGYVNQQVTFGGNGSLTISLQLNDGKLGEVVVVGYGTQKKVSLTSAVSTINKKDIENRPTPSLVTSLQGQVPGLNISQGHGQPGYTKTEINIRGISTLSNNPVLIVIDGVPTTLSLNDLNPNDIESLSVLKDASATSIYGARGSGGVVLVTTKIGKNKNGKPTVSYDGNYGIQNVTRLPVFVDAPQYVELVNLALQNDGQPAKFDAAIIAKYKSGELPSTNWLKLILSKKGAQQQHNVSVSGANDQVSYFLSGSIMDQEGLMDNVGYRRKNLRSNISAKLTDKFEIGLNSSFVTDKKWEPFLSGELGSALGWSYYVPVTEYPYTKDGLPRTYRGGWTPYQVIYQGGLQNLSSNTFSNILTTQYHLLPGLDLQGIFSYLYSINDESTQIKPTTAYWDDGSAAFSYPNTPQLTKANTVVKNPNLILTATYAKSLARHNFKVLAGYSQESQRIDYNSSQRAGFLNNEITQLDGGDNDRSMWGIAGRAVEWGISSAFGRINYDYEGKYLLEANGRLDASSRFLNKRRGFFPSVSAGWVVSNEGFLKGSSIFNLLKLRGSYGSVGNQSALFTEGSYASQTAQTTALYPFAALLGTGTYVLNNSPVLTTFYSNIPNPDITWEVKTTTNVGLDAAFFKSHLTTTVEIYNERTTGIIRQPTVPSTFGAGPPFLNSGEFRNRGYEIALGYNNGNKFLRYSVGINFSDNRNKILSLGGTAPTIGDNPLQEGHSRWEWFGYETEGFFQSQEDIDKHATQFNQARLRIGDLKLKDQNGDGVVNDKDRITLGEAQPHYYYGISARASYKSFDISFLAQGVLQNIKRLGNGLISPFPGTGNITKSQLDFWTPENQDALFPRLRMDQSVNYGFLSRLLLSNGAYLRLKNVQIGYTLPMSVVQMAHIKNLRIFFTGENLLTWTSKNFPKEADPETPNYASFGNYPQIKVFSAGLHVDL